MPIPKPKKNQTKNQYMDACMHFLKHEAKNTRPQNQRVAICLGEWGKTANEDAILKRFALFIGEMEKQCPEGQKY